MPTWITLTDADNGQEVLVNLDQVLDIRSFLPIRYYSPGTSMVSYRLTNGKDELITLEVSETLDAIRAKLNAPAQQHS